MQISYILRIKACSIAKDLTVECSQLIHEVLGKIVLIPKRNADVDKERQRKKSTKDSLRFIGLEVPGTVRPISETVLERTGVLGGELGV